MAAKIKRHEHLGAALLVPQSGQYAALGRSMERAAALVQGASDDGKRHDSVMRVYDTGGTPEGAANAARAARKAGASIIFGPVFAHEVPAVLGAIGREVPVITFSNDAALIESGAFLLGMTARQSVAAILGYASSRGIRRIAVAGSSEGWGMQARSAASALAAAEGLALSQLPASGVLAASADALPDAVLATDPATLVNLAPQLAAQGVQALGAFQGMDLAPDMLARLDGAWIAAPDPAGCAGFARAYEQRNGAAPGTIAALAYDAAGIAVQLTRGGGTDRSALLAGGSFKGVCGNVRFHEDGSAARTLAILQVTQGQLRTVATWQG